MPSLDQALTESGLLAIGVLIFVLGFAGCSWCIGPRNGKGGSGGPPRDPESHDSSNPSDPSNPSNPSHSSNPGGNTPGGSGSGGGDGGEGGGGGGSDRDTTPGSDDETGGDSGDESANGGGGNEGGDGDGGKFASRKPDGDQFEIDLDGNRSMSFNLPSNGQYDVEIFTPPPTAPPDGGSNMFSGGGAGPGGGGGAVGQLNGQLDSSNSGVGSSGPGAAPGGGVQALSSSGSGPAPGAGAEAVGVAQTSGLGAPPGGGNLEYRVAPAFTPNPLFDPVFGAKDAVCSHNGPPGSIDSILSSLPGREPSASYEFSTLGAYPLQSPLVTWPKPPGKMGTLPPFPSGVAHGSNAPVDVVGKSGQIDGQHGQRGVASRGLPPDITLPAAAVFGEKPTLVASPPSLSAADSPVKINVGPSKTHDVRSASLINRDLPDGVVARNQDQTVRPAQPASERSAVAAKGLAVPGDPPKPDDTPVATKTDRSSPDAKAPPPREEVATKKPVEIHIPAALEAAVKRKTVATVSSPTKAEAKDDKPAESPSPITVKLLGREEAGKILASEKATKDTTKPRQKVKVLAYDGKELEVGENGEIALEPQSNVEAAKAAKAGKGKEEVITKPAAKVETVDDLEKMIKQLEEQQRAATTEPAKAATAESVKTDEAESDGQKRIREQTEMIQEELERIKQKGNTLRLVELQERLWAVQDQAVGKEKVRGEEAEAKPEDSHGDIQRARDTQQAAYDKRTLQLRQTAAEDVDRDLEDMRDRREQSKEAAEARRLRDQEEAEQRREEAEMDEQDRREQQALEREERALEDEAERDRRDEQRQCNVSEREARREQQQRVADDRRRQREEGGALSHDYPDEGLNMQSRRRERYADDSTCGGLVDDRYESSRLGARSERPLDDSVSRIRSSSSRMGRDRTLRNDDTYYEASSQTGRRRRPLGYTPSQAEASDRYRNRPEEPEDRSYAYDNDSAADGRSQLRMNDVGNYPGSDEQSDDHLAVPSNSGTKSQISRASRSSRRTHATAKPDVVADEAELEQSTVSSDAQTRSDARSRASSGRSRISSNKADHLEEPSTDPYFLNSSASAGRRQDSDSKTLKPVEVGESISEAGSPTDAHSTASGRPKTKVPASVAGSRVERLDAADSDGPGSPVQSHAAKSDFSQRDRLDASKSTAASSIHGHAEDQHSAVSGRSDSRPEQSISRSEVGRSEAATVPLAASHSHAASEAKSDLPVVEAESPPPYLGHRLPAGHKITEVGEFPDHDNDAGSRHSDQDHRSATEHASVSGGSRDTHRVPPEGNLEVMPGRQDFSVDFKGRRRQAAPVEHDDPSAASARVQGEDSRQRVPTSPAENGGDSLKMNHVNRPEREPDEEVTVPIRGWDPTKHSTKQSKKSAAQTHVSSEQDGPTWSFDALESPSISGRGSSTAARVQTGSQTSGNRSRDGTQAASRRDAEPMNHHSDATNMEEDSIMDDLDRRAKGILNHSPTDRAEDKPKDLPWTQRAPGPRRPDRSGPNDYIVGRAEAPSGPDPKTLIHDRRDPLGSINDLGDAADRLQRGGRAEGTGEESLTMQHQGSRADDAGPSAVKATASRRRQNESPNAKRDSHRPPAASTPDEHDPLEEPDASAPDLAELRRDRERRREGKNTTMPDDPFGQPGSSSPDLALLRRERERRKGKNTAKPDDPAEQSDSSGPDLALLRRERERRQAKKNTAESDHDRATSEEEDASGKSRRRLKGDHDAREINRHERLPASVSNDGRKGEGRRDSDAQQQEAPSGRRRPTPAPRNRQNRAEEKGLQEVSLVSDDEGDDRDKGDLRMHHSGRTDKKSTQRTHGRERSPTPPRGRTRHRPDSPSYRARSPDNRRHEYPPSPRQKVSIKEDELPRTQGRSASSSSFSPQVMLRRMLQYLGNAKVTSSLFFAHMVVTALVSRQLSVLVMLSGDGATGASASGGLAKRGASELPPDIAATQAWVVKTFGGVVNPGLALVLLCAWLGFSILLLGYLYHCILAATDEPSRAGQGEKEKGSDKTKQLPALLWSSVKQVCLGAATVIAMGHRPSDPSTNIRRWGKWTLIRISVFLAQVVISTLVIRHTIALTSLVVGASSPTPSGPDIAFSAKPLQAAATAMSDSPGTIVCLLLAVIAGYIIMLTWSWHSLIHPRKQDLRKNAQKSGHTLLQVLTCRAFGNGVKLSDQQYKIVQLVIILVLVISFSSCVAWFSEIMTYVSTIGFAKDSGKSDTAGVIAAFAIFGLFVLPMGWVLIKLEEFIVDPLTRRCRGRGTGGTRGQRNRG